MKAIQIFKCLIIQTNVLYIKILIKQILGNNDEVIFRIYNRVNIF